MSLTTEEKMRVKALAEGRKKPVNGMEIHFVNVIRGKARACTPKEKEWMVFWQSLEHEEEVVKNEGPGTRTEEDKKPTGTEVRERKSLIERAMDRAKREITEIECRTDIPDETKASQIIHISSATCAGVAVQPIPFADIFILTPIQAYFGTRIAAIRGVPVSESAIAHLIKEIIGIIGMGVIAQQLAIGVWKLVSFGTGGLLTIPLVYALTYAVMKVIDEYYKHKAKKRTLSQEQIKEIWRKAFQEGKEKGEVEKQRRKRNGHNRKEV